MTKHATLSLALMSGKGGVGKTNLTLNLGLALAEHEQDNKILVMDADMGLANIDVLLGLAPDITLQDVIQDNKPVNDAIIAVTPHFHILPSASGITDDKYLDQNKRIAFLEALNPHLQAYDTVLLDLGAGIHATVTEFARLVAARVVVVTPEPTSLTDAYALIKILFTTHKESQFFIIVNQIENPKEERFAFERLKNACQHFLHIEPILLGSVRYDMHFNDAIRRQQAFIQAFPKSKATQDIRAIATRIHSIRTRMSDILCDRTPLEIISAS